MAEDNECPKGTVIGIDLGGTKISGALFSKDGRIIHKNELLLAGKGGADVGSRVSVIQAIVPYGPPIFRDGKHIPYSRRSEIARKIPILQSPLRAIGTAISWDRYGKGMHTIARTQFSWPWEPVLPEAQKDYSHGGIQVIEKCIGYWSMAVASLVSIFNPEKIIFGGGIFGPAIQFLDRITEEAENWAQPISMQHVSLEGSSLKGDSGLYYSFKAGWNFDKNDCMWIFSHTGINAVNIDVALEARSKGMKVIVYGSAAEAGGKKTRRQDTAVVRRFLNWPIL